MNKKFVNKFVLNPYLSLILIIRDLIDLAIMIFKTVTQREIDMIFDIQDFTLNSIVAFFLFLLIRHIKKAYTEIDKNKEECESIKIALEALRKDQFELFDIQQAYIGIKTQLLVKQSLRPFTFCDPNEKLRFENGALFHHFYEEFKLFRSFLQNQYKEKSVLEIDNILLSYYPKDYIDEFNRNNE